MPKIVDKTEKAQQIAKAAVGVFRRLGYHRTRMADIAEGAGIGKGTLYEYFSDKQDILRCAFEGYFEAFKLGAERAVAAPNSPGARLLALVDFALKHIDDWQDHCAVYVDYFGAARIGDDQGFSLRAIYEDMGAMLRALIEAGQESGEISPTVDPEVTGELLLSVFDGVVLHHVFAEDGCDRDALRKSAIGLLVGGLVRVDSRADAAPADPRGDAAC